MDTGIIEEFLFLDGVEPGLIDALEGSVILEVKPLQSFVPRRAKA